MVSGDGACGFHHFSVSQFAASHRLALPSLASGPTLREALSLLFECRGRSLRPRTRF